MDKEFVYIFDPYYYPEEHYKNNKSIKCVLTEPFAYNRLIDREHFLSERKVESALGPIDKREAVLFYKK